MKHLVAALVMTVFAAATLAEGTTPTSPPAPAAAAKPATPATTGTKKAKKKKAKHSTGAAKTTAQTPTK